MCEYIQICIPAFLKSHQNKKLYLAGGLEPRDTVFYITAESAFREHALNCNHTDADTRLIFHVKQIQSREVQESPIIVESPDTDVFILLLSHYTFFCHLPKIYFYTGRVVGMVNKKRYIPIHIIFEKIGSSLASALSAAHAITGCDTTCAFFYIGKSKMYAALKKMSNLDLEKLSLMHTSPFADALMIASEFVALLYDPIKKSKAIRTDINSLRYCLSLEKNICIDKLPPSKPAFEQHLKRVIWQMNSWSQATEALFIDRDPKEFGWIEENNILQPNYFEGENAMDYLDKYFCACKGSKACSTESCPCTNMNLQCCSVCHCTEKCANKDYPE